MWGFQPIFGSYLLVAFVAAGLFALLTVRPVATSGLTDRRRRILWWLRLAIFTAVVLAMLRPTVVRTEDRIEPARLLILADQSRSMSVADLGTRTRWQALTAAVESAWPTIAGFREIMEIQVYQFDRRAERVESTEQQVGFAGQPAGEQTDVPGSLDDALQDQSGNKLAAVVLLSDGAQRVAIPRVNWQEPARELARRGVPLYTIAIGQGREQSQARDVAIVSLPDQFTVFTGNELAVRGSVQIQGYADRDIPVLLRIEELDGKLIHEDTQAVSVADDTIFADVEFRYVPEQPGEFRLRLQAATQPDEQVTDNNELGAFLRVLEGGVRVLYLDGNPAWQEQKFIRRSIDTAPDVDLDYIWIDVRNRAQWPMDVSILFSRQRYDVVLLGDVHASALGVASTRWLADRTEQGLGLMMLGGAHSFGPGGYGRVAEFAKVLPVRMPEYELRPVDAGFDPQQHVSLDLRAVPEQHFITTLGEATDTQDIWSQLPPFQGANLLKPTGVGRVLLLARPVSAAGTSDTYPILIAGEYGRGRVLAFAADSTFRWYRYGFRQQHARFWRQAMLWLARKDQAEDNEVWIDLPQRRLPGGSQLQFQAGVRDPQGEAIAGAELSAKLTRTATSDGADDNETSPPTSEEMASAVQLVREPAAWSGTTGPLRQAGEYELRITASKDGTEIGSATARFLVTTQDLELTDPAANPQQLAIMSAVTKEAGGKTVAPEQLTELIQDIARRRQEQRIQYEERWQLGDTAVDAWLFFLILTGLLSVEWYLRKRWALA